MGEGRRQASWRAGVVRVPGLKRLWRILRSLWWRFRDGIGAGYWRVRAALPLGVKAKHRVSTVWGAAAASDTGGATKSPKEWLDCEDVLWRYVFPRFDGRNWYRYLAERYCPAPRASALSLCCGDGHVERGFIRYGICERAQGIDVSPDAIEVCRRAAGDAGLSDRLAYSVADVERIHLDRQEYDVVVAWMALHHLRRLAHVFREVKRALKPNGIFVVNEYVGPARFQFPKRQVDAINELLGSLPDDLRRLPGGGVKERFDRPTLHEIINHDPSEAVRSDRIIPCLRRDFRFAEHIEYGGSLLYGLLQSVICNFDPGNPVHREHLDRLYAAERAALERGEFSSDFAFIVAQRPSHT